MSQSTTGKPTFRILSFVNDKEDAESRFKLKEAANKIERALAIEQATKGLIDRQIDDIETLDPADDTRPLYQRLLDQRMQKQEQVEESQRLSNFVCKLDEDEVDFLKQVDKQKFQEEISRKHEEMEAIENYKRILSVRQEEEEKIQKILTWGGTPVTNPAKPETSMGTRRARLSNLIRIVPKSKPKTSPESSKSTPDVLKVPEVTQDPPVSQINGINRLCADYSDDDDDDDDVDDDKKDSTGNDAEPAEGGRETRSSQKAAANKAYESQSSTRGSAPEIEQSDPVVNSRVTKRKKQDSDSESDPEELSKKECISKAATTNPVHTEGSLKCMGILPSISSLVSTLSDSSDDSSDSSNEDYELAPLLTRVDRKDKQGNHNE